MTGAEFTTQVLAAMPRATDKERRDIRQELADHIEDRVDGLLELGLDREAAEERAAAAMGDPAEIGRALNRQLSPFWLWLGRAAAALVIVLCFQSLLGLGMLGSVWDSLAVRIRPRTDLSIQLESIEAQEALDIRASIGNDVLRVIQISIGQKDGQRAAMVTACIYDQKPFGMAADNLLSKSELENERGEYGYSGGGSGTSRVSYAVLWTPIEPEDTCVVWVYDSIAGHVRLTIPLPGEGEP